MLFIFVTVLSTRILIVKYVREKTSVRFHVIVTRLQTHPRTMTPRVDFCLWISYSISPLLIKLLKLDKQRQRWRTRNASTDLCLIPFTEKCIKVYVLDRPISNNDSYVRYKCSKGSGFVEINLESITMWPNGSIWIPLHKKTYDNGSFFINGSRAFICMNLTRHFTETTTIFSEDANFKRRQILTFVGCAISMISLILLLAVYITIPELRTLPGKNLMSLSSSMLFYHTAFLMAGQTAYPFLCMVVSVVLHYSLLSSFCWMSVMAFDVSKTFSKTGNCSEESVIVGTPF